MKKIKWILITFVYLSLIFGTLNINGQKKIRPSLKAAVSQTIGLNTDITIEYSRPGVKGRKIWGGLVPYGMSPGNTYSKGKAFPWRAGANESTIFETNRPIKLNGKHLSAGKYSFHVIPNKEEWILIFNKLYKGWGSYRYDETQDALRIKVKPKEAPHKEWLAYGFEDLAGVSANCYLHWEKLKITFKVEVK